MTADLTTGMFRGICVDNKDPKNLGRIRVQVPQILGLSASGWAFPAWSMQQKTVWPQDRLPKPGDGIWVMFDSTSPDKMIWMAAFGPLDLINQPEYVEMPDFKSTLTLNISPTPAWNTLCTFSGVLGSDLGGVPNPNASVELSTRIAGGAWTVVASDPVDTNGNWTISHTVQLTGQVEYRAAFAGVGVYGSTSSPVKSYTIPAVSYPTTLTLVNNTPSPVLGTKINLSGKLLTGGSPPAGYTVPHPNAVVNVYAKQTSASTWTTIATNVPVDAATGNWSTDYTIAIAGSVQYQAVFTTMGIYQGSSSSVLTISTSVATTTSAPTLPALTHGSAFSTSGTVKVTSTGANVTAGTVQLWVRYTVGSDQNWYDTGVTATVSNGAYSLTHPSITYTPGATQWQVRYTGTSNFDASTSGATAASIGIPTLGALTKGAVSHTSAAFSWSGVSGATGYSVEKYVTSWAVVSNQTGLSYSATGLSNDSTYYFRVRPYATDPAGTTIYGGYAAQIAMNTGHPAVTIAAGSTGWVSIDTNTFRCYRNDTGWQGSGDYEMRQGWYSSSYDGAGYVGIAKYTGSVIRDAIIAACGTDGALKQSNGTCSACQITLTRQSTDNGSTPSDASIYFYTTTSTGTGGRPTMQGSAVAIAGSTFGTAKTYNIGTAHGQRLGDGTANSVAIEKNSLSNYVGLAGSGELEIKWTWPAITKTALDAAAWV